jgi:hypothetical protein
MIRGHTNPLEPALFATVERIIAPISIIFSMNCQGQMQKGKLG